MDGHNIFLILATGEQLINSDFGFDYHEMVDSDVCNNKEVKEDIQNVQEVLYKIKEKRYDRSLINQINNALNNLGKNVSTKKIEDLLKYELASLELRLIEYEDEPTTVYLGNTLYFIYL